MANVKVGLGADNAQAESLHVGENVAVCRISLSATFSAGDVYLIGKLPNGAIPTGAVFYPGAANSGVAVMKFGTSASQELYLASATYSQAVATSTRPLGTRYAISISDDARVLFEYITMVPSAAVSVGHVGDLVVRYKLPGQTP